MKAGKFEFKIDAFKDSVRVLVHEPYQDDQGEFDGTEKIVYLYDKENPNGRRG